MSIKTFGGEMRGVIIAAVTPMDGDYSVDIEGERVAIVKAAVEAADGRAPTSRDLGRRERRSNDTDRRMAPHLLTMAQLQRTVSSRHIMWVSKATPDCFGNGATNFWE